MEAIIPEVVCSDEPMDDDDKCLDVTTAVTDLNARMDHS